MRVLRHAVPYAVIIALVSAPAALYADEAPLPPDYQAPLSSVTVFKAWEAPRSSVSLFYIDPAQVETEALEQALAVTSEDGEQVVQLSDRFLFAFDSAELRPTAQSSLDTVAALLDDSATPVEVIGHTDSLGTDEINQPLSEDRARAVADYLVENGIDEDRITSSGKGSTQPIADNTYPDGRDNPQGRQENRRVEVRYSRG